MDSISYIYTSRTMYGIWMIYIKFERGGSYIFKYHCKNARLVHSRAAASVESKMATMQDKIFCVREFIKTESATAVQRASRLRFNIQPLTFKLHCEYNHM